MTGKELQKFLRDHLVPKKLYKIDGKHNKRICMERTREGWDVFFSEKKKKIGVMHFADEESACAAMKEEIRKLMALMYDITWAAI